IQMPRSAWEWAFWLLVVGFPWALARRRPDSPMGGIAGLFHLLYACCFVLVQPARDSTGTAIATCGLLALDLAVWFASPSSERKLVNILRWPRAKVVLTVATAVLVPLGAAEQACRLLTDLDVLSYHRPILTVWRSGHDDWRMATITADEYREPDPVLL